MSELEDLQERAVEEVIAHIFMDRSFARTVAEGYVEHNMKTEDDLREWLGYDVLSDEED